MPAAVMNPLKAAYRGTIWPKTYKIASAKPIPRYSKAMYSAARPE